MNREAGEGGVNRRFILQGAAISAASGWAGNAARA